MRRCLPLSGTALSKIQYHNGADMLICVTLDHSGHRMSSGLWAPVGPPLNLGLMQYVHIQTMVPLSVYSSTQWWGKVVAGVIYSENFVTYVFIKLFIRTHKKYLPGPCTP